MAGTRATVSARIEVPAQDIRQCDILLIGETPLIVHSWSHKAKAQMLGKQMQLPRNKEAKSPEEQFEESLYRFPDGRYGFPSVSLKAAAVQACTSIASLKKIAARQAFHVVGESFPTTGVYPGTRMRADLVEIISLHPPSMREDPVRLNGMTGDIRYRGEFWPWAVHLQIRHNAGVISAEQLCSLFNAAGFGVGIGEWRPDKGGQSGMFHVATETERATLFEETGSQARAAA